MALMEHRLQTKTTTMTKRFENTQAKRREDNGQPMGMGLHVRGDVKSNVTEIQTCFVFYLITTNML